MRSFKLALSAVLLWLSGICPGAADPVKIRIGWVVPITDWAPFMMEKRDLARHFGKSYVLEPVRFASSPSVITALANNELDIGNLAFSTLAIAIQNAGLHDLRVISDLFQDGVGSYYSNEYFVLRDSSIQKVEDLRGKVIATPGAGGAIDIAMRLMLRRHGLEDRRDYAMVEAPMPAMLPMLAERKVALAPGVPPFSFDPRMRAGVRALFTQKEALGPTQMIVLTARQQFIERNRAAMVDLLEDNLRLLRWCIDTANRDEVIKIASRLTKQPPDRFAGWLFTQSDYFRDPNMIPNIAALQDNIGKQQEAGFLGEPLDIQHYVDLTVIKEAAARLK